MRTLELYEVSSLADKKACCKVGGHAKQIAATSVDAARKEARRIVEDMGYKVRSINFTTNGNVRVVATKDAQHPAHVIGGRVFRRPTRRR